MLLRSLNLRDFRNIPGAALAFEGKRQFFLGANGQGKTNVLEAAGCLTALRSFRTAETAALIRHGASEAGIACELDHDRRGETRLTLKFRADGKELWSDQERVRKLADHLGLFPLVAFSSQDLQLVRGAPAGRRRWLDLTLSAMDGAYLKNLQVYTRALADRNRLLKTATATAAELAAFEQPLAGAAAELVARRSAGVAELAASLATAYGRLCGEIERAEMTYAPSVDLRSPDAWRERWAAGRAADLRMRSTLSGPHKDDVVFAVKGTAAREFASEGQQRSLVLGVKLAQAGWFHSRSGVRPVILADDVLGELDPARRRQFWAALDPEAQVLATGTTPPPAELGNWQTFHVAAGAFDLLN